MVFTDIGKYTQCNVNLDHNFYMLNGMWDQDIYSISSEEDSETDKINYINKEKYNSQETIILEKRAGTQ